LPRQASSDLALGVGLGALLLCAHGCLAGVAVLRESHSFWLNSGGYSPLLRQAVQMLFYPALLSFIAIQIGLSLWAWKWRRRSLLSWSILVITSCSLLIILLIVVANNLFNLWQGRPLHWHPS
jgi:hypothetical protein